MTTSQSKSIRLSSWSTAGPASYDRLVFGFRILLPVRLERCIILAVQVNFLRVGPSVMSTSLPADSPTSAIYYWIASSTTGRFNKLR